MAFHVPGTGMSTVCGVRYLILSATTQGSCGEVGKRTSEAQATELELGVPGVNKPGSPAPLGVQNLVLSQIYTPSLYPSP